MLLRPQYSQHIFYNTLCTRTACTTGKRLDRAGDRGRAGPDRITRVHDARTTIYNVVRIIFYIIYYNTLGPFVGISCMRGHIIVQNHHSEDTASGSMYRQRMATVGNRRRSNRRRGDLLIFFFYILKAPLIIINIGTFFLLKYFFIN